MHTFDRFYVRFSLLASSSVSCSYWLQTWLCVNFYLGFGFACSTPSLTYVFHISAIHFYGVLTHIICVCTLFFGISQTSLRNWYFSAGNLCMSVSLNVSIFSSLFCRLRLSIFNFYPMFVIHSIRWIIQQKKTADKRTTLLSAIRTSNWPKTKCTNVFWCYVFLQWRFCNQNLNLLANAENSANHA